MEASLSYNSTLLSTPYEYSTISNMLQRWAKETPNKDAFVFISSDGGRKSLTYNELYGQSRRFASILTRLGVRRRDSVAISVANDPAWAVCEFAITMVGACACNISFTLTDGSDVTRILRELDSCKVLIVDSGDKCIKWNICLKFLGSSPPGGSSESRNPTMDHIIAVGHSCQEELFLKYDDLMAEVCDDCDFIIPDISPDDPAIALQTSGSTGLPKLACHSHFSIVQIGTKYARMGGNAVRNDTIYYANRSMSWSGGFPFLVVAAGVTHVTQMESRDRQSIPLDSMLDVLELERCTMALFLPQEIKQLRWLPNGNEKKSLELLVTGGQPITKAVIFDGLMVAPKVLVLYGATDWEIASSIVLSSSHYFTDHMCGFPSEGYEVKVTNGDDATVPRNTHGQIYVRATGMFVQYMHDQTATGQSMSHTGWIHTDDVGYMDTDGCLFVEGRQSETIVCGGIKVFPSALETLIRKYPGVKDVAVVPVPDDNMFEEVCACIISTENTQPNAEQIHSSCLEKLLDKANAFTRLPKYYLFVDAFPLTSTGKVSRNMLKTLALSSEKIQPRV